MGLDMYCYAVPGTLVENKGDTDLVFAEGTNKEEIFYWRKHHDLHGWMENLYREKGGAAESFNCVNVRLEEEDLDRLKDDIVNRRLPNTTGFFFGNNPPDDEMQAEDLGFIVLAREAIKKGMAVFYDSWW